MDYTRIKETFLGSYNLYSLIYDLCLYMYIHMYMDLQITCHVTQNTSHGEYNLFPLHTYKLGSHFSSGTWEELEIACEYSERSSQAVAKKEVAFTSIYLPFNFPSPIIHYCFLCISSKFPNTRQLYVLKFAYVPHFKNTSKENILGP